jgi:hypothetical protein
MRQRTKEIYDPDRKFVRRFNSAAFSREFMELLDHLVIETLRH